MYTKNLRKSIARRNAFYKMFKISLSLFLPLFPYGLLIKQFSKKIDYKPFSNCP